MPQTPRRRKIDIAEAGEVGDADTVDLPVGVSRDIDKNLWLAAARARARR